MANSWPKTENDLLKMKRDQVQESLNLEFKKSEALDSSDSKKNEISKDVSAFANSEGGDIIYGVLESGQSPSKFGDIDCGIDASKTTIEWLEQVVNSRIHPRIDGIVIKPIPLHKTCKGCYVYVVHIPASQNAPHQASDNKYYKRFNFQSVPMEDYEVRDVRNRWIAPIVVVKIRGRNRSPVEGWDNTGKANLALSLVLKNVGKCIAQQVYMECDLPSRYIFGPVIRISPQRGLSIVNGQEYRQFRYHHRDESGPLPLFPNTDHETLDGNKYFVHMQLKMEEAEDSLNRFIYWTVYADSAEPRSDKISVGELFKPLE